MQYNFHMFEDFLWYDDIQICQVSEENDIGIASTNMIEVFSRGGIKPSVVIINQSPTYVWLAYQLNVDARDIVIDIMIETNNDISVEK